MTTITITISVDAGSDAHVSVGAPTVHGNGATYVPPFNDELVPLPDGAIPLPGDTTIANVAAFRGAAMQNPDICPVHLVAWKQVPAGVSKKTGKPYDAFRACPTQGCDQRPR